VNRSSEFGRFILNRAGWISDRWTEARRRQPELALSGNTSQQQLAQFLPLLCQNLAKCFQRDGKTCKNGKARLRDRQPQYRWREGYNVEEIIRELAHVRQIISVDCLNAFARETAEFDLPERVAADGIIDEFFDDLVLSIVQQFATEKQKELAASEQNSQSILDSALDCIIVIGDDGRVREWNIAAERLFGYPRERAVSRELVDLIIPPELRARHLSGLARYRATGEGPVLGRRMELPALRADGTRLDVELSITPYEVNGKPAFTAYVRDITERMRSEARRSAQYAIATLISGQAPLIEIGPKILSTIARSGRWLFAALWVLNKNAKLTCHSTWGSAERDMDQFEQETRRRVFSSGEGLPGRVLVARAPMWLPNLEGETNHPRTIFARMSGLQGAFVFPLFGSTGINGVIELFADEMTPPDDDLHRLAGALGIQVGLYLERERTEEELRRQKEAAVTASQAKDRFLAALSHELRTPLNPVLMWACSALEDPNIDPEMKQGLKMICRNIEMEARLIDDLLDLTRIARGKLQIHVEPCRADALMNHALEIVRGQLSAKRLKVTIDLKASSHQIIADPIRIEQVFWNLLNNAYKFSFEDGEVEVRSYDLGPNRVAFEISDSGPGIDEELMPKLFTAFEQGTRSGQGLGLGLAICKAVIQMHKGKIKAANKPNGHGAVFTVELTTEPVQGILIPMERKPAAVSSRKLSILIVEDHENTATVMSKLLKRSGHEVVTASTVRQAMQLLHSTPLDLLVSDLGLPDGNGFEVMTELSKISDAKGIAISGYGMEEDVERSCRAGFSAHLTKPIDVQKLQETIQQVTAAA
jgi:two-component system, chemotaxis family, CheB/CheR fusion protein